MVSNNSEILELNVRLKCCCCVLFST